MGLIKFFCTIFFLIKRSIFARLNWPRSEFLNPNKFIFFDIFIPFATANETLREEKLPGPLLTNIEKLSIIFTLCFFIRFNMFETKKSLLLTF